MKKRTLIILVALVAVFGMAVGGTIAWLTDQTEPITNTFTVGNINIELKETATEFKMVPGVTIVKDPKITVKSGSEACYLFVKVEKSANLDDFINYIMATGWTALTDADGVYYRVVNATTSDTTFSVLADDQVTCKDTVTKAMMDALTEAATYPTLTFTAYAVQQSGSASAAEAWAKVTTTP